MQLEEGEGEGSVKLTGLLESTIVVAVSTPKGRKQRILQVKIMRYLGA